MKVYRISKTFFIKDISGTGARIYGGRWNHKGVSILYTSQSRALATVEYLVHVPLSLKPKNLSIASIELPDDVSIKEVLKEDLPANWRDSPPPSEIASIGTGWILAGNTLGLRVPSASVENDFNLLINPVHPEMSRVKIVTIEPYEVDRRLLR